MVIPVGRENGVGQGGDGLDELVEVICKQMRFVIDGGVTESSLRLGRDLYVIRFAAVTC